MLTHQIARNRVVLLLLAIAFSLSLLSGDSAEAQEGIDISGEWSVVITGDLPATCTIRFTQTNTQLAGMLNCGGLGTAGLSGTIDPIAGSISLTGIILGVPLEIEGTATQDGDGISGTWIAFSSIAGSFTGTRDIAPVDPGSDLTGRWIVEFPGTDMGTCTAAIVETGASLSASISCDAGSGLFSGTVNGADIFLSGSILDVQREIVANSTPDGTALAGTWIAPTADMSGGFIGVRNEERSGSFDMSGTWDSALAGGFSLSCDTVIEQTGTELASVLNCGIAGAGTLAGSIDLATGAYRMSGDLFGQAVTLGVLSDDGQSASGAWAVTGSFNLSGTLTTTRTGQTVSLLDLTGDWNIALVGGMNERCSMRVNQAPADLTQGTVRLTAIVDCDNETVAEMSGSLTHLRNRLTLRGSLNDREFFMEGRAEADRSLIRGVWYTPIDPNGTAANETFGCFVAVSRGLARPDACTPPDHHPLVQLSGLGTAPDADRPASTVLSSDIIDSRRTTIAGLAGLAAGALALGLWSAWLGWRR